MNTNPSNRICKHMLNRYLTNKTCRHFGLSNQIDLWYLRHLCFSMPRRVLWFDKQLLKNTLMCDSVKQKRTRHQSVCPENSAKFTCDQRFLKKLSFNVWSRWDRWTKFILNSISGVISGEIIFSISYNFQSFEVNKGRSGSLSISLSTNKNMRT